MARSPIHANKQAFAQYVVGQMAGFATVQAKAMFGGFGIYLDGLMFALIVDDQLYFKADDQSIALFTNRGLEPFRYETKKGTKSSLSYYLAPPEVYDEADEMAKWARLGYDCAVRQQAKPASRRKSGKVTHADADSSAAPAGNAAITSVDALPNLGPKSQEMLAKAGITDVEALRQLGAVMAYVKTKAIWPQASLNLLWALEGALSGRPWQQVAETDRASLLMALEDVQREFKSGTVKK
ncbi:MAG: TfoX/Sxy family DNA transformation protein [Acidobacteriota bacterium]